MSKTLIFSALAIFVAAHFSACLSFDNRFSRIAPGTWRGVLELEKIAYPAKDERYRKTVLLVREQFQEGELPFNFNVVYKTDTTFYVEIINGAERIRCDSIRWGWDKTTARDTMNIYFPEYQSYIHADVRGDLMAGEWVVTTKDNYRIPFRAKAAQDFRFTNLRQKPAADLTGEWATLFGTDQPEQDKAIGEFKQEGNRLTGTFRTETGDYRFLEGTVQEDHFWLSCFDGSHAFLFSGKIVGDSLLGEFRSGKHYQTLWAAWRDPNFRLGDPDSLATATGGSVQFSFKTPDGRDLTYPSPAFDGKIKIFTVSGTWCPNCRDEQLFLAEYLNNNPDMAAQIAVVSLSFERFKDEAKANAQLLNYKKTLGLPFDLVLAGKADKKEAERVLPALSQVMAFPTMLILDKQGKIRRVHTGFDGPATSKYGEFKKHFEELMRELAIR